MGVKLFDITKATKAQILAYIDGEALPFIRMNEKAVAAGREPPFLNPRLEAIRYELVKQPDGTVLKRERNRPLLQEVGEVSNQWLCDARTTRTDGEKVFGKSNGDGNHCTDFAKYHDEHRLDFSQPCSIEPGDIEAWRDNN